MADVTEQDTKTGRDFAAKVVSDYISWIVRASAGIFRDSLADRVTKLVADEREAAYRAGQESMSVKPHQPDKSVLAIGSRPVKDGPPPSERKA